jgi:hypothetical protein
MLQEGFIKNIVVDDDGMVYHLQILGLPLKGQGHT